jgi:hypothetical protein
MDDNRVLKIWFPIAVPKSTHDLRAEGKPNKSQRLAGRFVPWFRAHLPRSGCSEIETAPSWNTPN